MNLRIPGGPAVSTTLAALVLQAAAHAGSVTGTAWLMEPIALPADAAFEAVLIDAAIADAPARALGQVRLQPAGQPPIRFTIPFRDSDRRPTGRYAVRASVLQGSRLLFTTDTFTPALTAGSDQPLKLRLVPVTRPRPAASTNPLGPLPASWRGDLPDGPGRSRWQLDLAADGSFQLRQSALRPVAPNPSDDIGRWRLEAGGTRLVLRGGREAPLVFQPLNAGAALRKLDLNGQPLPPGGNDRLQRLSSPEPIEPRLHLQGLFSSMADAPRIRLCATGASLPVAMEGDYLRLERAYLQALGSSAAGQPLLVNLVGQLTPRPSAEPSKGLERTLVVDRFVGLHPGRGCPDRSALSAAPTTAPPAQPGVALRGSVWRLQALEDGGGPGRLEQPPMPVELILAAERSNLSGNGGCNRLIGSFQLQGEQLRFSPIGSTMMACSEPQMAFERRYLAALGRVRRWSIDKSSLLLQDERGCTLLLFTAAG